MPFRNNESRGDMSLIIWTGIPGWLWTQVYDTINQKLYNLPEKDTAMSDKKRVDRKTFIENVNKKDKKRNGLKIHFAFVNRKRKG